MVEWQQMAIHDDCGLSILRLAVITPNNDSCFRPQAVVHVRKLSTQLTLVKGISPPEATGLPSKKICPHIRKHSA